MRVADIISRRNSNRLSLFSSYNFASVVVFDSGMPVRTLPSGLGELVYDVGEIQLHTLATSRGYV